jgi:hypothetical protein
MINCLNQSSHLQVGLQHSLMKTGESVYLQVLVDFLLLLLLLTFQPPLCRQEKVQMTSPPQLQLNVVPIEVILH